MDTDWPVPARRGEPCALAAMLSKLGGKWKCVILWWLMDGPHRFTALRKLLHGVTQKMLTQRLRELEHDGFVTRTVFAEVPLRVEYAATPLGMSVAPVLAAMHEWGAEHLLKQAPKRKAKPATVTPKAKRSTKGVRPRVRKS